MFERDVYVGRRSGLVERLAPAGGLVLLPGNGESPMNYGDNAYPFRQDSTFLYYFGLAQPDVAAVIDVDSGRATLFGDELTVEHIVWMGELPTLVERAERSGVTDTRPLADLADVLAAARWSDRPVHYLPPYRADTVLQLARLLGTGADGRSDPGGDRGAGTLAEAVAAGASAALIRAVVAQRSIKGAEEVAELERAVATSVSMHEAAMGMTVPGVTERAIAAEVERIARAAGGRPSFPVIATINGQTLHNHDQRHTLAAGRSFLLDCGAETAMGYAGDLTSSFPVTGRFSERQRAAYDIVLRAYDAAVARAAPGIPNREVHLAAARVIFDGLKELGIGRGETEQAVAAGAHAVVFPHGIGHMMGLDVHDMENLGEDHVGYGGEQRSRQFGLKSLRLARPLEPGFVITIEPGVYFIPQLMDDWRRRNHCGEFIDYDELDRWRDQGGYRNEEDYLITDDGARRLGPRKPQTVEELEARVGAGAPQRGGG
jgi:Xaa-Pro aminopeptidase